MPLAASLRALLGHALDLIYPPRCLGCGAFGRWLCPSCLAGAERLEQPLWVATGQSAEGTVLPVWSYGRHEGVLRESVHRLKYQDAMALAEPIAALMAAAGRSVSARADALVAVPLHRRRERERGYNQSRLLARHLGALIGLPLVEGQLLRLRDTPSQVHMSSEERLANVSGAFEASVELRDRRVVLVDDVCTSGATLLACAEAVASVGGKAVAALTFTRALPGAAP